MGGWEQVFSLRQGGAVGVSRAHSEVPGWCWFRGPGDAGGPGTGRHSTDCTHGHSWPNKGGLTVSGVGCELSSPVAAVGLCSEGGGWALRGGGCHDTRVLRLTLRPGHLGLTASRAACVTAAQPAFCHLPAWGTLQPRPPDLYCCSLGRGFAQGLQSWGECASGHPGALQWASVVTPSYR